MRKLKIDGNTSVTSKAVNLSPLAVQYRTGDVVVVQSSRVMSITDTSSIVLLRFPNGELLTTILNDKYKGKVGDLFYIKVQGKDSKHIYAKIITNNYNPLTAKGELAGLLSALDLEKTEENYQIITQMLKGGIEVNQENFLVLKNYKKNNPSAVIEQLAFMIKDKIPINMYTVNILSTIMQHEELIGELIIALLKLTDNQNKTIKLKELVKNLYKNPKDSDFSANTIKNKTTILNLKELIEYILKNKSLGDKTTDKLTKLMAKINLQYYLADRIGNPLFIQIPINNNGLYDTVEFYIEDNKENNYSKSVYLRIPTLNLGNVEVLLNVDSSKNISCYVSSDYDVYIKKNIVLLYDSLRDLGFRLVKITYKKFPSDISFHNLTNYIELICNQKRFDERV